MQLTKCLKKKVCTHPERTLSASSNFLRVFVKKHKNIQSNDGT